MNNLFLAIIHFIEDPNSSYIVKTSNECKCLSDQVAYESCRDCNDTISMGTIVVTPL